MKALCSYCDKEFDRRAAALKRAKNPTCSSECRNAMYKEQNADKWYLTECTVCQKEVKKLKSRKKYDRQPCCSYECRDELVSRTQSKPMVTLECPQCGKEFEVHPYRVRQQENITCSRSCAYYYRFAEDKTQHPRYNESITDEERIDRRKLKANVIWRNEVLARDDFTCQLCGQYGGKLVGHHLNGYHWDKENRLNVDNGVTLCKTCHNDFHSTYSNRNNTKAQFDEYANLNRTLDLNVQGGATHR